MNEWFGAKSDRYSTLLHCKAEGIFCPPINAIHVSHLSFSISGELGSGIYMQSRGPQREEAIACV